jgi:iron complex outermembrane recepter protein
MTRILALTAIALTSASCPSWSQSTRASSDALDAVIVTGSRIARPDLDRLQPTVVLGSEAIENRGETNLIDALSDIPAFGPPPSS